MSTDPRATAHTKFRGEDLRARCSGPLFFCRNAQSRGPIQLLKSWARRRNVSLPRCFFCCDAMDETPSKSRKTRLRYYGIPTINPGLARGRGLLQRPIEDANFTKHGRSTAGSVTSRESIAMSNLLRRLMCGAAVALAPRPCPPPRRRGSPPVPSNSSCRRAPAAAPTRWRASSRASSPSTT